MKWLKHLRVTLFVLSGLAMVPFLMNCVGWASYLLIKSPDEQLVIGTAVGVVHLAKDRINHDLDEGFLFPSLMPPTVQIVENERFEWLIEGGHGLPIRSFAFHRTIEPDYSAVEFPYLLVPLVFLVAGFSVPKSQRVGLVE